MNTIKWMGLLSILAGGCGGAHLERSETTHRRVRLEGNYMAAMGQARVVMAEHCGGRFEAFENAQTGRVDFVCTGGPERVVASR